MGGRGSEGTQRMVGHVGASFRRHRMVLAAASPSLEVGFSSQRRERHDQLHCMTEAGVVRESLGE